MVRRMHRTPTGPTGVAITIPTSKPFRKKPNAIPAQIGKRGPQSPGWTGNAQPETRDRSRDSPALGRGYRGHRVPVGAGAKAWLVADRSDPRPHTKPESRYHAVKT